MVFEAVKRVLCGCYCIFGFIIGFSSDRRVGGFGVVIFRVYFDFAEPFVRLEERQDGGLFSSTSWGSG